MFKKTLKIKTLNELEKFAKNLSRCLKGNEVILLSGNLAAGKTTFTRYLVSSIDEEAGEDVISPTFSIMNEYITSKFPIYHIDLYRVKHFDYSDVLGNGLVIIEWANFEEEYGNLPVVKINFEICNNNERLLTIYLKNCEYLVECLNL